jgi:hypothetical protein
MPRLSLTPAALYPGRRPSNPIATRYLLKENLMTTINLALLADPFPIQAVSFYPGSISTTGTRCQAIPYVTSLHLLSLEFDGK